MTIIDELTTEYLQSIDWEFPIKDLSLQALASIFARLSEAAKTAEEQENNKEQFVFTLLGRRVLYY